MTPHWRQRRILLFVIAIIVPSFILIVLGLRLIGQERELAEKRLVEDQRRWAGEIRQELLRRLEGLKLQEASAWSKRGASRETARYESPEVALVCSVEKNRLILPWESNRQSEEFQRLATAGEFARKIRQGEQEEFADKQFIKAAGSYRQAMRAARHQAQSAYAELSLARALTKSGRAAEANNHYRAVLSSATLDDQGVPLALYAAERLFETGTAFWQILEILRGVAEDGRWMAPAAAYLLRDLAGALIDAAPDASSREAARAVQRKILDQLRDVEQALALQNDFPALAPVSESSPSRQEPNHQEPKWTTYGAEPWLISLTLSLDGAILVAARAHDVFASLETINGRAGNLSGKAELIIGGDQGELLGASFPGLRVNFTGLDDRALARRWNLQRAFYLIALSLVLSGTLFSAYLLWRDVRRELRLAEMRSQFVSSVSHELKTPLTAIRMFAETLRMGRTADQRTQAEYLDTIVNESERLTRLLNNVLDFSKIEQGKKTYHLTPTSLVEVARDAARALEYPLAQQGFELRVEVENGLPAVKADRDALEQAILNLLTNAMKYSGESREIGLRLSSQNGHAVIRVTDRGLGVAPEEQARIFEKFYRVPTSESTLIPGAGLGLTLVAHIAQSHGGRVEVQSAPGAGSEFSIHIPLEAER